MFLFDYKKHHSARSCPRRMVSLRTWTCPFFHRGSEVISCLLFPKLSSWMARHLFSNHPGSLRLICYASIISLMGVDSHSRDFKEQRGGYRCVTTHRVLICSEKGGIQSGSFSSSRTEHRAFSKRPAVIQCISEIKASPHSCLMLTDSWRNWSFHSFLLYLLFRSLPWSLCNSFQT